MPSSTSTSIDGRQLQIAVRRLADSLCPGSDASTFIGSGIDYAQSRLYQPGDPIKNIDWRLTARTGKHYLKEYDSSRRLAVYLLLDASNSMRVGSAPRSKYGWAILLAGALALSALDRSSPVALFDFGTAPSPKTGPSRFCPSLSREQLHAWLEHIRQTRPGQSPGTSLSDTLGEVNESAAERSIVIVLSDLHEPTAVAALKRLAQRHDVLVLRMTDPAEAGPIGKGIFRGQEAESGQRMVTNGKRGLITADAANQELRRAQIDVITLRTDQDFVPALRLFLSRRGRRIA